MTRVELTSPATLPAPIGYSHVASIPRGSRLVWTSGQVAITADGVVAAPGDWEAQTRLVI
jgi:enamine deaminase RidA (YjgF/YER057c/UK114 family)